MAMKPKGKEQESLENASPARRESSSARNKATKPSKIRYRLKAADFGFPKERPFPSFSFV
jgi:hypothetical protein